jgi:TRAP transporter TAXI family solute receptor
VLKIVSDKNDSPSDPELDQALADYFSNCDSGCAPDREQFLSQYSPQVREQLASLLSVADWLERLSSPDQNSLSNSKLIELKSNLDLSVDNSISRVDPHSETLPLQLNRPAVANQSPPKNTMPGPTSSVNQSGLSSLPCRFGDYELQRVLGRGGMGVVYYARQLTLDRPVAIKMIRSGALASEEEVQRFYAEARSAARLNHPRIVTVYQCGEYEGHHFFSMDYVDGTDLDKLARMEKLDPQRAARYVRDAAEAIQFAHDQGILHRDLKPANILIDRNDQIQITDFGLAKNVGANEGLTATGAAIGTPSYMSPEQAAGRAEEQNQSTDVYSLGAILYAILTGEPPFKGENILQTILHVIHRQATRLRSIRSDVPEDLETIVDVCLQKSPSQRYQSAAAMADDLNRFLKGIPIKARPVSRARRIWYWVLGVPVIGALLDHRVIEPTDTHRWVQRGMMSAGSLMILAWLLLMIPGSIWFQNRMPRLVRIAAGSQGGEYDLVARVLAEVMEENSTGRVEPVNTDGSAENIELLGSGKVQLALLQADVVDDSEVAVIAPIYYEVVHLLRRSDCDLESLADLRSRRVYLGREKAGSRATASRLLEYSGINLRELEIVTEAEGGLKANPPIDAAILVTRVGAAEVTQLLASGAFQLMSFPKAWEFSLAEPAFHPIYIQKEDYIDSHLTEQGVSTIATTAFLVCHRNSPDVLVNHVLSSLYRPEVRALGILSAEQAAQWQGIAWHPAAKIFFRAYRGSRLLN